MCTQALKNSPYTTKQKAQHLLPQSITYDKEWNSNKSNIIIFSSNKTHGNVTTSTTSTLARTPLTMNHQNPCKLNHSTTTNGEVTSITNDHHHITSTNDHHRPSVKFTNYLVQHLQHFLQHNTFFKTNQSKIGSTHKRTNSNTLELVPNKREQIWNHFPGFHI